MFFLFSKCLSNQHILPQNGFGGCVFTIRYFYCIVEFIHCNESMKYYLIAGEASGDLHGSNLIKELHKLDRAANIRCWGGNLMQDAGATLVKHYKELAFMGFTEVIMNLRTIFKNIAFCKQDIEAFAPQVLVLIDYPGFNLRISEWAKNKGYTVVFYISPQVWAWKENRVKKMKQTIDHMMVILPFEKEYYQNKWNWEVEYVGHPLVQVIENFRKEFLASRRMKVCMIRRMILYRQYWRKAR